ncbi:MAG: hypothetical protein KIS67_12360 [Verrucomicrobiae bacterium]|nr:hypothetical protein [Verrucomicrobiae bacterium]
MKKLKVVGIQRDTTIGISAELIDSFQGHILAKQVMTPVGFQAAITFASFKTFSARIVNSAAVVHTNRLRACIVGGDPSSKPYRKHNRPACPVE